MGHGTPVEHQIEGFHEKLIKEEPQDADYFCKATKNNRVQSLILFNLLVQFVFICGSSSHIFSNNESLGGETSSCVVHLTLVDRQTEKPSKEEEPNEDDYLCKTTGFISSSVRV